MIKLKKNASDILSFESRLKQKEDIIDDVQRENALTNGRDYYHGKIYCTYCIYCTNIKVFHLNIHQVELIYGNQLGLIIIVGIQIWMLYL